MNGKQMLQLLLLLAALVALAWIAFYLLLFALAAGAVTAAVVWVRRFLINKGIIVPSASAQDSAADGQTIEVEYSEVTITQGDAKEKNHG